MGLSVLLAGVALAPLLAIPQESGSAQAPRAALVGIACLVFLVSGLRQRDSGRGMPGTARLAGWIVVALGVLLVASSAMNGLASAVWGVHGRFQGLVAFAIYAVCGLCGFLAAADDGRERAQWLAPLLAGAVIVEGVLALGQSIGGGSAVGTLVNPVLFGGWACMAVSFVVPFAYRWFRSAGGAAGKASAVPAPAASGLLAPAAVAVGLLAIGASGSRGAWVGLVFGLVAFAAVGLRSGRRGLPRSGRRRSRWLWTSVVATVLVMAGAALDGGQVLKKLDPGDLRHGSAASRLAIWQDTGRMIGDHPALGVGVGRYLFEYPQYESQEHAKIEGPDVRPDQAHSIPLQLAAEGGVLAALAGVALWVVVMTAAWRVARSGEAVGAALVAGLAAYGGQGLFGIMTVETQTLAFFFGGAALALAPSAAQTGSPARPRLLSRTASAVVCGLLVASCVYYSYVDAVAVRTDESLARASFDEAFEIAAGSVRASPLVDVYRVKMADAARFLAALGDEEPGVEALVALDAGLALEPADYDLALARARVLRATGAPAGRVLAAYERAAALYPMGVAVREEMASVEAVLAVPERQGSEEPVAAPGGVGD